MSEGIQGIRGALVQISEVARNALEDGQSADEGSAPAMAPRQTELGCTPKVLPARLQERAAWTAAKINPVNAPVLGPVASADGARVAEPLSLTLVTGKYWGPTPRRLTVSFLENTPSDLQDRIISHLNAWARTTCISFTRTEGTGQVRISTGPGGYWSYLGTDILLIPNNRQTMNLQGFTMRTDESEFRRVIRHEAGHTLGFPHEHMRKELVERIHPDKAYDYFWRTQGWPEQTVDEQVLTPLDKRSIIGTPADQTSIMCYQLPGQITRDGQPILGGTDINQTDYAFAGTIYPVVEQALPLQRHEEWSESEDVTVEDVLAKI